MRTPRDLLYYLQAYTDYFYKWEDAGEVVTAPGVGTLCYRGYLIEVLESLVLNGTPSVGAVLLAILATGTHPFESYSGLLHQIIEDCYAAQYPHLDEYVNVEIVFTFLETLSCLPVAYRSGSRRLQVLQTIFQEVHNPISAKYMGRLLAEAKTNGPDYAALCDPGESARNAVTYDVPQLALLHQKFPTAEAIVVAVAALPPIEEPLELPENLPVGSAVPPANFVAELKATESTFHVGALVPAIWAGLHLPLQLRKPSAQPLGGISDISNRGTLDKLLISEYAYDDLLALSRLANGEALYYRREVPPEAQSKERMLLLDASLQGWGTPHSIMFAMLLAIAQHPKTDISCTAFAVGNGVQPLAFSTVHEVVDSLSLLEATTDAAGGLEGFLSATESQNGSEIFFLTSPAGFRQPAVQKILALQQRIQYCLVASSSGECTVYKRVGAGLQKDQPFTLPLGKLWRRGPASKADSPASGSDMLLLSNTYPILFPQPAVVKQYLRTVQGYTYAVSRERTLLLRENGEKAKGWIPVLEGLPAGPCKYELAPNSAGQPVFLCYLINTRELLLYNLAAGEHTRIRLPKEQFGKGIPLFVASPEEAGTSCFLMNLRNQTWIIPLTVDAGKVPLPVSEITPSSLSTVEFHTLFEERELESYKDTGWPTGNVFKNVKEIYIKTQGRQLVVNSHLLWPVEAGTNGRSGSGINSCFELVKTEKHPKIVEAQYRSKSMWEFTDGSKIILNTNGMLLLESSCSDVETVYLPTVLSAGVGMATRFYFAGNPYYRSLTAPNQKTLSTTDFYRICIQPFIDHILNHEA